MTKGGRKGSRIDGDYRTVQKTERNCISKSHLRGVGRGCFTRMFVSWGGKHTLGEDKREINLQGNGLLQESVEETNKK